MTQARNPFSYVHWEHRIAEGTETRGKVCESELVESARIGICWSLTVDVRLDDDESSNVFDRAPKLSSLELGLLEESSLGD